MEASPSPRRSSRKAAAARAAPRVVAVLAGLLERAAERGDAEGEGEGAARTSAANSAAFRGRALPGIPVRRYVERVYRYAGCSPACFVVAYVYLDRLARGRRGDYADGEDGGADEEAAVVGIDSYTVHRLLITSVLVAAKFMDDRHNNNAYFALVGGVEVAEMNALELHLLSALRFRLNVHPDTFARYCAALECQIVMADPTAAAIAAVPLMTSSSPVVSDDDDVEAVVTDKAEKGAAAAVPAGVVVHSHHHRTAAVVQTMTTAQ